MAARIHVTRPTKIELARLKRRLRLAQRIQKIIKDRLSILVMEFLQTVRESARVKDRLQREYQEVYKALSLSVGYHGYARVERVLLTAEAPFSLAGTSRNVAGVRLPMFEMEDRPEAARALCRAARRRSTTRREGASLAGGNVSSADCRRLGLRGQRSKKVSPTTRRD